MTPRKQTSLRLRIRAPLRNVSLIYAIPLRKLASELTGQTNLKALFAWCAQRGVGVDGFRLSHLPGGNQGEAWLDAQRQRGVFLSPVGNVAATLVDGEVKGDPAFAAWLAVLPSTSPAAWGDAAAPPPASATPRARAPASVALTARVDVELTARAQVAALTATQRKQLVAAAQELCGKRGLSALMAWCDAEGQGLAHVAVADAKAPRFEGWLTAALEDGAFFDAGQAKRNGLTVSQGDVGASTDARRRDVAALQKAMRRLKAPRAPRWRG